jgi:hypothetical protein
MLQAKIDFATSGDKQVVAGVASQRIRVVNFVLIAAAAVNATWKDGTTALTGAMTMATGVPIQSGYSTVRGVGGGYDGHFDTSQGADLTLNLSGNVQVSGWVNYVLVP